MGYEIFGADFGDFISPPAGALTFPVEKEDQIKITIPKGDIRYKEQFLHEQLSILEVNYSMQDDVTIYGKGESALLEIQFNLSDKDIFYQDKSRNKHTAPAGSGNIAFLATEENEARILFQKDVSYNTFDIHLPLTWLDHYAGESGLMDNFLLLIHKDISSTLTHNPISISPAIYSIIRDVKTCIYDGLTRRIYLESKAYELIALLYEHAENKNEVLKLSPADRERIHLAASLIRNNLEKPLTIIQLARQAGINQTKLKTGFKSLFGRTVFGYLQDIKMQQAKRYLLDTALSIQEIGMLLGYQNTSNFSIAFKNIHGYSPIKLRRNRGPMVVFDE